MFIPGIPVITAAITTSVAATAILVVSAPASNAGTTNCYNNSFGYSCSGPSGTTNCYNNSFGTSCSGPSGTTNCYDNSFGTSCSGSSGTTNCYNNSFGTSCSGSSGTTNCYDNSFGTSCTGTGSTYIPLPKPTPSYKTYYADPTPTPSYKTYSTQVCTTSQGLAESCKTYPSFYIEFCSANLSGALKYKSGSTWSTLWDVTGVKNDRCNSSKTPYYTVVSGELKSKSGLSLKLTYKAVNGVTPTADLFSIKIK